MTHKVQETSVKMCYSLKCEIKKKKTAQIISPSFAEHFKGNCKETKEVISASRPILLKDELIALAARLKMHLLIQHVHQYMMTPSHPKLPNATLAPRLHLLAQNLLKVGKKVKMSEDDVEFLHGCLRDCL